MIRKTLATSDHWLPRLLRSLRQGVNNFSVPAPKLLAMPLVGIVIAIRSVYYFVARVFVCEPFFKAYCTSYGRRLHTGVFLHWVQGGGRLIIGDDVSIDGKCNFHFGARRSVPPTLTIGSNTSIGHGCTFAVNKQITIGRGCLIAGFVSMFDSPGHSTDPEERAAGMPVPDEEVRPVVMEDNVWVGWGSVIMPGVTIGKNSVVAVGSVVTSDIPPNTMALGNPARKFPLPTKAGQIRPLSASSSSSTRP